MNTAPQLALPRTKSEELEMDAHHDDGRWHRRTRDLQWTACGLPLYRLHQPLRPASYEGPLCASCFTPFEHQMSAELARREQELKNGGPK